MNFLTPLAFSLAALIPVVVALYFLKLRREDRTVSSTYLWRALVRDTAANAPWQRLKPNLLLILQLLFLAALIAALARPFAWMETAAGSHLILVIDTSASMASTDVRPNRLASAVASARRLIDSLPVSARVTLIEAGTQVRVPVSGATDRTAALAALAALKPGIAGSDMAPALTLAAAVAAREPDSEIVVLSDGHVQLPENLTLPGRVRYLRAGEGTNNQGINLLSIQAASGGRSLSAFAQVTNWSAAGVQRRLVVYADGKLLAARDMALPPGKPQNFTLPDLPPGITAIEARLEGQDMLTADDRAWAVAPPAGQVRVTLASPGNRFLETALGLLPNVETTLVKPSASITVTGSALTILDGLITGTLPAGNLLFIAPARSTDLFSVTGRLDAPLPVPAVADEPVLRFVDLREVAIQEAARVALPRWGRAAIVDSRSGAPLLIVGEESGRRLAVLAFDLRRSDLPLRVAFPVLVANLVDALVPGSGAGLPQSVEPGKPIALSAPRDAVGMTFRGPGSSAAQRMALEGGQATLTADAPGVYEIEWLDGAGTSHPLGQLAVNTASAESDITPRETLSLGSAGQAAGGQALPRGRREWWQPIAWAALAVLVAEWLLSNRGQLARLWKRVSS